MPIKSLKSAGTKALGQGLGGVEEPTDPEFNKTVLLLHADGSEGEGDTAKLGSPNYKAFKDNSTSAHAITVQGDAYGTDFSPYYYADGYWSILFDHNNDDKVVVGNTQTLCGFGYEDFQIDCMIYSTRPSSDSQGFFGTQATNTSSTGWRLQYDGTNIDWNHGTSNIHTFAFTFTPNTWFHFVIQRVSGTFKIFIDGVEKISASDTTNYGASTNLTLGNGGNTGAGEMSGYLSNLRVITGGSSTTSKITTPFTDPSVSGEMAVEFDGSADYLKITTASDFDLSTNQEFSLEFWLWVNAINTGWSIFFYGANASGQSDDGFQFSHDGSGNFDVRFATSKIGTSFAVPINSWNHIVVTRDSSGYIRQFLNGVLKNYNLKGDAIDRSFVTLGSRNGGNDLNGYLSNVRWVKGSIPTGYQTSETSTGTSVFTPPSAFLTTSSQGATSSDVKLLTCQSKTFTDESGNQGIEVFNNSRITEFSPFNDGYWSNYFDGSGDYLSIPYSNDFNLGSSNFTVEAWVKTTGVSGQYGTIVGRWNNHNWDLRAYSTDINLNIMFALKPTSGSNVLINAGSLITDDKWHHVVAMRSGNNIYIGLDGTIIKTQAFSGTIANDGTTPLTVAKNVVNQFKGYISNVRVIKGSAIYSTSGYTVPTSPLTTTSQGATASEVKFLGCQSNRFIDNSSSARTITVYGDPSVEEKIPFELLSRQTKLITCQGNRFKDIIPDRYPLTITNTPKISTNAPFTVTKTANVGSGFFDGTGDYLNIPTSTDFDFGTGDFTLEFWVYPNEALGFHMFLSAPQNTTTQFGYDTGNGPRYLYFYNGANIISGTGATSLVAFSWNHVALVREGTTISLFSNGNRLGTSIHSSNVSFSNLDIARYHGGGYDMNSYMSDIRAVKGSAVYDPSGTRITIPTTTLASTGSETKLLTIQYSGAVRNVGFLDDSKYNHQITRNGEVNMGTFSPFSLEEGYWSVYFNGNYLNIPDSSDFTFGSSNFSIAVWVYRTDSSASTERGIANTGGTQYTSWLFTTKKFWASTTGNSWGIKVNYSQDVPVNQWVYVQVNRVGNVYTAYHNGVSVGTVTASGSLYNNNEEFELGFRQGATSMVGYMSNFIMTNGGNLASTNVPTAPFTADSNTKLLCLQSNRYIDNSNSGHTITPNSSANTFVKPFSPFAPTRSYSKDAVGGSVYYDGAGDYLTYTTDNLTPRLSTNWSIEFWMYLIAHGSSGYLQQHGGSASNFNTTDGMSFQLYEVNNNMYYNPANGSGSYGNLQTSTRPTLNSWTHIVITNDGTQTSIFLNGVRVLNGTSGYQDMHNATTNNKIQLGYLAGSGYPTKGYFTGLQYHDAEVYDASSTTITVPTAPKSADANTLLLSNFSTAGIIDHTMRNNLETTNNARIRTDVKQFGTGSIFLDGSDELNINDTNSETFYFGTGQFTIEAFIRVESTSSSSGQWFSNEGHGGWTTGGIAIWFQSTMSVYFYDYSSSSPLLSHNGSYNDGVMRHYAIVRGTSGACALFVDGTRVATGTHTGNVGRINGMCIGNYKGQSRYLTGFIDGMRVTKEVARYDPSQTSVTVPIKAFANR